jgi:hypothetical protein
VQWQLRVDAHETCGGKVELAPKSSALLECIPKFEWWSCMTRVGSLFRPLSSPDATLILNNADTQATQPPQPPLSTVTLPVSAQFFSDSTQQWANYVVVLFFLLLGAGVSLILSAVIPNRLTRITLGERLHQVNRMISGMGEQIDSSLRIRLRVEGNRLEAVLLSRSNYSPEFALVVSQCSQGIDRLQRRLALVEQLGGVLRRLGEAEATTRISWTHAEQARAKTSRAQEILRKDEPGEADFAEIEKAIADATQLLDNAAGVDPAFQDALLKKVDLLKKELPKFKKDKQC